MPASFCNMVDSACPICSRVHGTGSEKPTKSSKIDKYPGLLVNDIDEAKYWIKMGIKVIVYSNTSNLLLKIYQKIIKELKN